VEKFQGERNAGCSWGSLTVELRKASDRRRPKSSGSVEADRRINSRFRNQEKETFFK